MHRPARHPPRIQIFWKTNDASNKNQLCLWPRIGPRQKEDLLTSEFSGAGVQVVSCRCTENYLQAIHLRMKNTNSLFPPVRLILWNDVLIIPRYYCLRQHGPENTQKSNRLTTEIRRQYPAVKFPLLDLLFSISDRILFSHVCDAWL